jgi:endonuclease III related protein
MECRKRPRGDGPFLVMDLYNRMYQAFGPQFWWPAETPFEVMVGAILTQNTSWKNVETAIMALKDQGLMSPEAIASTAEDVLAAAIKPSGYYRQKAARVRGFSIWLIEVYAADLDKMFSEPVRALRDALLARKGIGPETADSILLYAGGKPVFVIDAYTRRIVHRAGLTDLDEYDGLQRFFERNLPVDTLLYKEFHALLVELGKNYCLADQAKARCGECPVGSGCESSLLA